jgi:hypothetical protein
MTWRETPTPAATLDNEEIADGRPMRENGQMLMMWLRLMRPCLPGVAALLGASHPVLAQTSFSSDDTSAYCRQLTDLYRRFVAPPAGWSTDLEASLALEACRKGNPEGIPVLEKKLRESQVSVPGREFKP